MICFRLHQASSAAPAGPALRDAGDQWPLVEQLLRLPADVLRSQPDDAGLVSWLDSVQSYSRTVLCIAMA